MGWRSWGRKKPASPAGRGDLAESYVLGLVAQWLEGLSGLRWQLAGDRVQGPGRVAVVLGHDHEGDHGHVDLTFVLDTDRPDTTSLPDCVSGFGATHEAKLERAVEIWATTTGAAVLEMLEQQGRHGVHFSPGDHDGFPGWHAVQGGIVGWGAGQEHDTVQHWASGQALLPLIAPAVAAEGLAGRQPTGIKFFFGTFDGKDSAEVRINGRASEPASAALLTADWPRPRTGGSYARTYAVLVHPG